MAAARTPSRQASGWAAALALAWAAQSGGAQAQMLAAIPVHATSQQPMAPAVMGSQAVRIRAHAADAAGLASFLGQPLSQAAAAGFVELTVMPGTHLDLDSPSQVTAASFIVDFDDPAVVQLSRKLLDEAGAAPIDGARIVAFTAKAMRSGFAANADLASEVARSLQGDCTEHALLNAALSRAQKIPARIVHGAALLHADGQWQAYGHAWVQTLEAGRWVVRDSALANWPGQVYYVPTQVITNEGPGYRLGMMQGISRLLSRVDILGSDNASSAP